jgi:hypothetical protein
VVAEFFGRVFLVVDYCKLMSFKSMFALNELIGMKLLSIEVEDVSDGLFQRVLVVGLGRGAGC